MREKTSTLFKTLQDTICSTLEQIDGQASFHEDLWDRPETESAHGGGGRTRILRHGSVFEQAGVNFSEVSGTLPESMCERLLGRSSKEPFYATGTSLVLHPASPMIPTTHANFRYLEVADKSWFGGGMDLTPYYLFEDDARHFHKTIKATCDKHNSDYYPRFKKWCDEYFYLPHRGEARGVGGIFYDYLGKDNPDQLPELYAFSEEISSSFLDCYIPIVERRRGTPWSEAEREFQLMRRGRYVEFNLLYDRGTQFGLHTGGRTESILMSLPPLVRWEYNYQPVADSHEERTIATLKAPREWV